MLFRSVAERVDEFIEADLNLPLPHGLDAQYDVVVAGDILEHVVEPHLLLGDLAGKVRPGGELLVSVPNFGHWYPRTRIAVGKFDYDQRGPLDRGHIRFFTRAMLERLIEECGLRIIEERVVGTPFNTFDDPHAGPARHRLLRGAERVDRTLVRAWPRMFGYQCPKLGTDTRSSPPGRTLAARSLRRRWGSTTCSRMSPATTTS